MIGKAELDGIYRRYNRRQYVHPDPLEFLYRYPLLRDREIAGLIASSLAYGRVAQILKSVEAVLKHMGRSPSAFLRKSSAQELARTFRGFKHRFTTDIELVSLLSGMKCVVAEYGSLNDCFVAGFNATATSVLPALAKFAGELKCCGKYLIPVPASGSACKRLNLFLRWMVRKDAVDPGGWKGVPRDKLIVPLDTHMAKIGQALGLTGRRTADMRMAMEITDSFRKFAPGDPVKYDFALTRFGIRDDMNIADLLAITSPRRRRANWSRNPRCL
jgi:uncharacterized protein (TIGR02757 family)